MSRDIGRGFEGFLWGNRQSTSKVGSIVSEGFSDSVASVERSL